jgi:predicted nucleotidyltransferase
MVAQNQIDHITRTIVHNLNPRRIVLFGSHARGTPGPDSDLDLFIEMESQETTPERAIRVSRLFGLRPWSMDVVVYTPEEVRRLKGVNGTLLSIIDAEGKVLYERP